MAGFSDTLEDLVLDWALVVGSPTRPAGTWLALYTTAPTDSTAGTEVSNANNYSRQAVTMSAASGGATSNSATVTWPTASGSWGTVVAAAVVSSATHGAGNIIVYASLAANKTVGSGDVFEFLAGEFDVTLD